MDQRRSDSAGVPWEGRQFEANPHAADDGSAPPPLLAALRRFRAGSARAEDVLDALRDSRLLVPLLAELGDTEVAPSGHVVDKSQELAIVTVAAPDGRSILPAFTSVAAMGAWNPAARPVPVEAVRVALAAAGERTDLVVLDPLSDTEFVLRRPAVWALAQGKPWQPAHRDPEVLAEFRRSTAEEPAVRGVELACGDPDARLAGPELVVRLTLAPGLDRDALTALLGRLRRRWAESVLVAERVDSMTLKLAAGS